MKPDNKSNIVSLVNVSKSFGHNNRTTWAVRNVTFQVSTGEMVLLIGPSGSGKTTLLTLIAGLIKPTYGTVQIYGKKIIDYNTIELQKLRAYDIGFVFQSFHLIDPITVLENVAMVLRFTGQTRANAIVRSRKLLAEYDIGNLENHLPSQLSQGEKQRVALVRSIANDPKLIIADEPSASLETSQGLDVIQRLHTYSIEHDACVIVASHDLRLVDLADRVIKLEDGALKETII